MKPPNYSNGPGGAGYVLSPSLALGVIGGVALDQVVWGGISSLGAAADFRLISEAWRIIQNSYVDRAAVQPLNQRRSC